VIESGAGWWNVAVEISETNPDLYALAAPRDIVRNGQLGSFATGVDEQQFLLSNRVKILSPPVFSVSLVNGYHSSNALIGLMSI
jgi:hypothetical protein